MQSLVQVKPWKRQVDNFILINIQIPWWDKRSAMERRLFMLVGCLFVILVSFTSVFALDKSHDQVIDLFLQIFDHSLEYILHFREIHEPPVMWLVTWPSRGIPDWPMLAGGGPRLDLTSSAWPRTAWQPRRICSPTSMRRLTRVTTFTSSPAGASSRTKSSLTTNQNIPHFPSSMTNWMNR